MYFFIIFFSISSNVILTDPLGYEEDICGGIGSNLIVCYNNGILCGVQKFGGRNLSSDIQEDALKIAKERSKIVEEAINTCKRDQLKL